MSTMFMPLRRYADFNGRSRRKEFWLWTLFNVIVVGALTGILVAMFVSAMFRVGERGGIQRVDNSSIYAPTPVDGGYRPSRPDADAATNAFQPDPVANSADELDAFETAPEEGMNFRAYGPSSYNYSAEYLVDPVMLYQEMGAGFWAVLALLMLWALATFIPNLAVAIRRLHDQDKSGWFYLLNFVPFVGPIIMFVFYLLDGTRGPNQYGPDPKNPYDPGTFA